MKRVLTLVFGLTVSAAMPAGAAEPGQVEGRPHKGPHAYYKMCNREPSLCAADRYAGQRRGATPPMRLTHAKRKHLAAVNRRLNRRIRPGHDHELYGVSDYWTKARETGDCEDYIIAKKHALMLAGWSADQLLYAVVDGVETRYHAVLIVRTDRGDLVLDNLRDDIVDWRASGYRFVIRQSAADPQRWVRVTPSGSQIAARRN